MNHLLTASCLAVVAAASANAASAQNQRGSGAGAYLADRYGMTCSGFIHAADAADAVRLQAYKDALRRLIEGKWSSIPRERLRHLVHELVTHCETHGAANFETAAKQVIARIE